MHTNPLVQGEYVDRYYIHERNLNLLKDIPAGFLANKFKKTEDQIVFNLHMILDVVPIPGTSRPDRMKENLEAGNFIMKNDDIDLLSSYKERKIRFVNGSEVFGINIFA